MENENDILSLAKKATEGIKPQNDEPATLNKGEQAEAKPQEEQKPLETPEEDDKVLGEVLEEEKQPTEEEDLDDDEGEEEPEVEMVPKSTFLKVKSKLKDEIRKLKSRPTLANLEEIAESVADKYNTNPDFVREILEESTGFIEKRFEKEIEEIKNKDKVKEIESKKNQLFDGLFDKLVSQNPDIANVVNKEYLRKEALDPKNSKKTLKEIVKDIYGGAIETKKISLDGYKPSKEEPEPENLLNADIQTQKEIVSNPKLRKKFGEELAKKNIW